MTPTQHGWQLETRSAELYERFLVPTVTLPWARDLIARVELRPAQRVLDVACGTGVVARLAASAVGEGGRVAAVDVNRGMLEVARALPVPSGAPIDWHQASADALPFGDGAFDTVLCQLGLQFFPDCPAALRELRRVLAVRGRLGASVFTSIERNPAARALADAVDRHVGGDASRAKRSEHSLSDAGALRELFEAAGFDVVRLATATLEIRFRSVEEWVEIQFTATPLADLLADCDETERRGIVGRVSDDVAAALPGLASAAAFAFPQEAYVVLADA